MKKECLDLLNSVDAKKEELKKYLSELNQQDLNRLPAEGKWSAIMTVHHLILAEAGSLVYCKKKMSFDPELEDATPEQVEMETKVPYMLRSPKHKIQAPPGLGVESLDNTMTLDIAFSKWDELRNQIRSFIESQPEEIFSKALYKHPLAGKMRLIGMIMFYEGHLDSHSVQIKSNFETMVSA